jgi:hypothetical protein
MCGEELPESTPSVDFIRLVWIEAVDFLHTGEGVTVRVAKPHLPIRPSKIVKRFAANDIK